MSSIYIVIRTFSKDERPSTTERSMIYGWSKDKNTIKAFIQQRDPKKYYYKKFNNEDLDRLRSFVLDIEDEMDNENMIDFIKLKSAETKETIMFYSTAKEMQEAEKRIQQRFHDMCSIDDIEVLRLLMCIDRYYLDALELLGFRPKEVDYLLDSSDARDGYNTMELAESEIDDAYSGVYLPPSESFSKCMNPPGLSVLSHVGDKILYSLENFVTALRDDL